VHRLALSLALLAPLLAGCASHAHPDVMASVYPLQFLAEQVGGGGVSVGVVVRAGTEPHDYEPTTGDMERLVEARLVLLQGAGLEPWARAAREQSHARFATATDGIALRAGPDGDEGSTSTSASGDPHTWLDPVLYKQMAGTVEAAMAQEFPEHADAFHARAAGLSTRLDALDAQWKAGLADCQVRAAVTNHAAFGYLAARYGFEMVAINGLSPDTEPSPRTMQRIVDEMRARNLTVVYFEDLVSPAVAEAVAREAGATTRVLSPVEGIATEDAKAGADYFTRMQENLDALREGMKCR
jgi:zinc transport system substrate-binding protein